MKALVLAGGFPQIDLIKKLKERQIETILADYYRHPIAKDYADKTFRVSTLDVDAIRRLAIDEQVDFIITVCTDQALLTMAKVSEDLNLPCYLDYDTARNVTNKSYMKRVFAKEGIPSAGFAIANTIGDIISSDLRFPLVVKPADSNSSKGVRRVSDQKELEVSFHEAVELSRTKTAIVEAFVEGTELSVDVYVEDGNAKILDITKSEKLKCEDKFLIFRTWHPAGIPEEIKKQVQIITQQIADAFGISNAPMLIQMLLNGDKLYVIEFSARTGGGVKHLSVPRRSGVDVVSAVIDLTLGKRPHIDVKSPSVKYMVDEYIYCHPGTFDHMDGFKQLVEDDTLVDYYQFRWTKSEFSSVNSSGDRIGGFTIEGNSLEELLEKHQRVNCFTRVVSTSGSDIMRHDFLKDFCIEQWKGIS